MNRSVAWMFLMWAGCMVEDAGDELATTEAAVSAVYRVVPLTVTSRAEADATYRTPVADEVNVARGKTVRQTSHTIAHDGFAVPGKAVDGHLGHTTTTSSTTSTFSGWDTNFTYTGFGATTSNPDAPATEWIEIDLAPATDPSARFAINEVVIWSKYENNCGFALSDFHVFLSERPLSAEGVALGDLRPSPVPSDTGASFHARANLVGQPGPHRAVVIPVGGARGRYLRLQHNRGGVADGCRATHTYATASSQLQINEIEAFGRPVTRVIETSLVHGPYLTPVENREGATKGSTDTDVAPDAVFRVRVDGSIRALALVNADGTSQWDTFPVGEPIPAGFLFTQGSQTWRVGVYENGVRLNRADGSIPVLTGTHDLVLYATDNRTLDEGRQFRVVVQSTDGTITSGSPVAITIPSGPAPTPHAADAHLATRVGCFGDSWTRDLTYYAAAGDPTLTPASCAARCDTLGYRFAGVQWGSHCFCSNSAYRRYWTSTACNTPCSGDASKTCGGSWANEVYELSH